ncbi:hypothetical protein [Sorangium cellulosum]|uniref:Uncharacterized protein n=2 Tax=Sorangium cellulosum TaxID=56 RepID=S4XLF4_SORCE|nr:hypothetical protein [Sorangium cellulosum]AGP33977.1 hypothetical protein SCE1572_05390 [Sorangium cellulosum So0157-2]
MKGTDTSAAALRSIEPSSSRPGGTRAGGGRRGRASLRAAAAGTGLLALAALVAGCPLCNGNDVGCSDGAHISGPIGLAASASARIEVRACRNGSCGEATLGSDPGDSRSSPGPTNAATASVDGGRFGFALFDDDPTNAQWELSIDFSPDFGKELEDGDVYSVSVIDADTQRELVSFERTILYGELQPNGEGPFCTSCNVADIKLPPPATQ